MNTNISKEDIEHFFQSQECSTCPFKQACEANRKQYNSLALCTLFDLF